MTLVDLVFMSRLIVAAAAAAGIEVVWFRRLIEADEVI